MLLTNKKNLNELLVKAIQKSEQYSGDGEHRDYSITELINPTRIVLLNKRHKLELVEDVSEKIFKVLGTLTHLLLERANESDIIWTVTQRLRNIVNNIDNITGNIKENIISALFDDIDFDDLVNKIKNDRYVCEKRYKITTSTGKVISGGIDLFDRVTKRIEDWKLTSVFTWIYRNRPGSRKDEWTKQLNMYRYLMMKNGYDVNELKINMIFRDFSRSKSKYEHDYPDEIEEMNIEILPIEVVESFIEDKVNEIEKYNNVTDDELPVCTPMERWQGKDTWAVMKKTNKTASKVCFSYSSAEEYINSTVADNNKLKMSDFRIEKRSATPIRCLDFCGCREYCKFYKSLKK